jgi:DNA mismatch repair protein MSH6
MSKTKMVRRYWNPELREMIKVLQEAREILSTCSKAVSGTIMRKFDEHYNTWMKVVHLIGELDCIMSLSVSKGAIGGKSSYKGLCRTLLSPNMD